MNPTVSRRTLAKGAAWSAPVVLAASPVHAQTYSELCPTDDELNRGVCDKKTAAAWGVIGAKTYSSIAGRIAWASTTMNFGTKSLCFNRGLVSWRLSNRAVHKDIPKPQLFLPDGTVYTGVTTLGANQAGGAQAGFNFSLTVQWENSSWSARKDWTGADVFLPMLLHYTAPDRSQHNCQLQMKFKMTRGYSGIVRSMGNPHFEIM